MATSVMSQPNTADIAATPCSGYEVHPVFGYLGKCKHCGFTRGQHKVFLDNNDPKSVSYIPFEEKERRRKEARRLKLEKYNDILRQKRFAEARALMAEIEAEERAHMEEKKQEEARVKRSNSKGHFRSLSRPKLSLRRKKSGELANDEGSTKPSTSNRSLKSKSKKLLKSNSRTGAVDGGEPVTSSTKSVTKVKTKKKKKKKKKKAKKSEGGNAGGLIPPPPGNIAPERPVQQVSQPVAAAAVVEVEPVKSRSNQNIASSNTYETPGHRRKPSGKWRSQGGGGQLPRPSGSDFALELEDAQELQLRLEQVQAAQKVAASKHRQRPSLSSIDSSGHNKHMMTQEEREIEYEKGRQARERIKVNLNRERESRQKEDELWRQRVDSSVGLLSAEGDTLNGEQLLEHVTLRDRIRRDTRSAAQRKHDEDAHRKQIGLLNDRTSTVSPLSSGRFEKKKSRLEEVNALFDIDPTQLRRRKPNRLSRSNTMEAVPPSAMHQRSASRGLIRRPASAAAAYNRQNSSGGVFGMFRRSHSRVGSSTGTLPGIPEKRKKKKKSKKGGAGSRSSENPMFEVPVDAKVAENPYFVSS